MHIKLRKEQFKKQQNQVALGLLIKFQTKLQKIQRRIIRKIKRNTIYIVYIYIYIYI